MRIKLGVIGVALILLLAGCDPAKNSDSNTSTNNGTDTGGAKKTVAVIVKGTQHEFWQTVRMGAEAAGKESNVEVTFKGPAQETDIPGQIALVEDAINAKVGGLVLAACDVKALAPAVDKAAAANIPVITIDSGLESDKPKSFVATDNKAAAAQAADEMAKAIGGKGEVAIVNFVAGAQTAIERQQGFTDQITAKYPNIKIVAVKFSEGDQAKALAIAQDLMTTYPNLAGIFGCNEGAAVGVARAVKEKGKDGKIIVIGFDSSEAEINAINDGSMQATIVQNPYKMGYEGVKNAVAAMEGKNVEKRIDTGAMVINKANIATPEAEKLLYPMGKK